MAARPSDTPGWATDAGRRLEPTAAEKASGWEDADRVPARILNWIQGVSHQWLVYFGDILDAQAEHIYPNEVATGANMNNAKSRTILVSPAQWERHGADRIALVTTFTGEDYPVAEMDGGGIQWMWLPLNRFIPGGSRLSKVRVRAHLDDNAAGNGITLQAVTQIFDSGDLTFGVDASSELATDDGTIGTQLLDSGAINFPVRGDPGAEHELTHLVIQMSGSGQHRMYVAEITFDDPGPRNF